LHHRKKSILAAIAFLCVLGCSQPEISSSPTSIVTGVVSYRGTPLAKGNILFQHQSGQTVSADIQSDGTYRLDAFQGENRVAVISREPSQENPSGWPRIVPGKNLIPPVFGEFRKSGLMAAVQSSENQLDFDLQDGTGKP